MPKYVCHAMNPAGRPVTEEIEGESPYSVTFKLRERGLRVYSIETSDEHQTKQRRVSPLNAKEVTLFNNVLQAIGRSSRLFPASIMAAARDIRQPRVRNALTRFSEALEKGASVTDALEQTSPKLPALYVDLMRAGESAENLPAALDHYGQYAARMNRLRRRISGALAYPLMSGGLILMVFAFLCIAIVPGLRDLYLSFDAKVPRLTQVMYAIGVALKSPLVLIPLGLLIAAVSAIAFRGRRVLPPGLYRRASMLGERVISFIPWFSRCYALYITAQFSQTMTALLRHGVALEDAVGLAVDATGSERLKARKQQLISQIAQGGDLPSAMEETGIFAKNLSWVLKSGWANGDAVQAFNDVGELAERDFDSETWNLVRLIAPAALAVIGLIVFCAMLGVLLPFLRMPSLVQ